MNHAAIWTRRTLTTGLTVVAFVNSYAHTAQWFKDHGQHSQAGWLALIPEVGVILVVLTLAGGGLSRPVQWLTGAIGSGSLAITFTANIAGSSPGLMGLSAALVAPIFAVLGFSLEVVSLSRELADRPDEPVQASPPEPVRQPVSQAHEPVDQPPTVAHVSHVGEPRPGENEPAVSQRKVQRKPVVPPAGGLLDSGIMWAIERMDQGSEWPTVTEIMAEFPAMSRSTAKRIRAAIPSGTDGTAELRESVNA
jgi:hypothetical protein